MRHRNCPNCGKHNTLPSGAKAADFRCWNCGSDLVQKSKTGEGLIAGAAVGGLIGGPPGAVIGGILGALFGSEVKG